MALAHQSSFENGHDRPTLALDWGRNGLLVAGGGDNSIRLYGVQGDASESNKSAWRQVGIQSSAHSDDVNCVAWHPTKHDVLASCADDGSVKIWKVEGAE